MKKAKTALLCCLVLAVAALVFVLWERPWETTKLLDWEDESIEVELYNDMVLRTAPAYDREGNAYSVRALVRQSDGTMVQVLDGAFRADYAGGYTIVYTAADEAVKDEKTVTVKIKNGDTPAPYFCRTRLNVFETEDFDIPEYGCALDPAVGVVSKTLSLYRVQGEARQEVEADLTGETLRLPAADYVFAVEVTAENGKSGRAELPFRVRPERERGAIASLNDVYGGSLAISYWDTLLNGWALSGVRFDGDTYRNEYVSCGSACSELPGSAATGSLFVAPELSKEEFVEALSQEGAVISLWLKVVSEDKSPRTARCGQNSVVLQDGKWVNLRLSAREAGYEDRLEQFYFDIAMGRYKLLELLNPVGKPYTVFFDSIYVAAPLAAELPAARCAWGETVTVQARSARTDDFYYELYDITQEEPVPQRNGDGTFTPRIAGTVRAAAYPASNHFYADDLTAAVTVEGEFSFGFESERLFLDYGWHRQPDLTAGKGAKVCYWLTSVDDSACYAYLKENRIRIFEGEYLLYGQTEENGVTYGAYSRISGGPAPVREGDLENFDNPSSVNNVTTPEYFTYLGDYEGAEGVICFHAGESGVWPGFTVLESLSEREKLEEMFSPDDLLAVRFLVEDMPPGYYLYYTSDYGRAEDCHVAWTGTGWQTQYIPARVFFENYENWFTTARLCFSNNVENEAKVYIDWVRLVKAASDAPGRDARSAEYQNFDDARGCMEMARLCQGLPVVWMDSFQGAEGVVKLEPVGEEVWPTITGFTPAMKRQQYLDLGYGPGDEFVIRLYSAYDYENYTADYSMTGQSADNTPFGRLKKGWNELRFDAGVVLDHFDAFARGPAYIVFSRGNEAARHELYLDSMYFEKGISATVSKEGILTIRGTSDVYAVVCGGKELAETGPFTYDLRPFWEKGRESYDISVHITRTSPSGEWIAEKDVIWSTPAPEYEINGFGSTAGQENFRWAMWDAEPEFLEEKTDCFGVTKRGVALVDFAPQESPWPAVRFGEPLCEKAGADRYGYVIFTMYVEGNPTNLVLDYKDKDNNLLIEFAARKGWTDYWIPAHLFDYDAFARGEQFFVAYTDGNLITQKLYIDSVRYANRVPAQRDDNTAEFMYFNDSLSLMEFGSRQGSLWCSYREEFGQRKGVVRMGVSGIWPSIVGLTPRMGRQEYLDLGYGEGDFFVLELYKANQEDVTLYYSATGKGEDNISLGTLKTGWNTVKLDASVMLDNWDGFVNQNGYFMPCNDQDIAHELYFDALYFQKRSKGVRTEIRADFVDLSDGANWEWYFATADGQQGCSYDTEKKAVRYQGSGPWPGFGGFLPVARQASYEKFRGENFVLELETTVCKGQWNKPNLYFKDAAGRDTLCAVMESEGGQKVTIPAALVLDNWKAVLDGSAYFYFYDGGGDVTVDCWVSGMYFEKGAGVTLTENGKLSVNGGTDVYSVTHEGTALTPGADGTYDLSAFADGGESRDIVVRVVRRSASGQVIADEEFIWSTPAAEYEINGFGSTAARERIQSAACAPLTFLEEKADGAGEVRYGVAMLDLAPLESPWPAVTFGAPLCEKPAADHYNYVVFTMYLENDQARGAMGSLVLHYKDADNRQLAEFRAMEGWTEYWVPLEVFDYDAFARGEQFFVPYADGNLITQRLYVDGIRYEKRAAAETDVRTAEFLKFGDRLSLTEFGREQGGQWCRWLEEYDDARGVLRMEAEGIWPTFTGFRPRLSLEDYEKLGYGPGDDFVIRVYQANTAGGVRLFYNITGENTGNVPMGTWEDGVLKPLELTAGWNTLRMDAGVILDNWEAFINGPAFFMASNDQDIRHELYFDSMYFEKAAVLTADVSPGGLLTVRGGTDSYEVTDGNTLLSLEEGGCDVSALWERGRESYDIGLTILRKDTAGNEIARGELTWSTPAAEQEINGFGSTAAREKMEGAWQEGVTVGWLPEKADGSGAVKQGVMEIDFASANTPWPTVRFSGPLCERPADGRYDYVVFTMYVEGDISNLTLDYKQQREDGSQTNWMTFRVEEGWAEYRLPVKLFDYDAFARGEQFLVAANTANWWDNLSQKLYIDGIRYESRGEDDRAPVLNETRADFVHLAQEEGWQTRFATAVGQNYCSYDADRGAVRYQVPDGTDEWPPLGGFQMPFAKAVYEQLYGHGNLVIEMTVNSYSDSWGAGCYPKLYLKDKNNQDVEYALIDHTGDYRVVIPASVVLENWEEIQAGSAYFFFGDWGAKIGMDCHVTAMYFTPGN